MFYFVAVLAYSVEYAITPEHFPINIRNSTVGLCNLSNRVASIISPAIEALVLHNTTDNTPVIVLYSIGLLLAGFFSALISNKK